MSHDSLEAMKEAHLALIAALDANDIAAIEAAVATFSVSVQNLRDAAPPQGEDAADRARELRRLSDQARMRVNFLTDVVRRRRERLDAARGCGEVQLYAREGR
ncbi:MAG: hypothetical protein ACXWUN_01000 [Allosphingosinicella sp.]